MFSKAIGDTVYFVDFEHSDSADWEVRHTTCTISTVTESIDKSYELFMGWAWCDPNDNFNRNTGRKIALKRALENFDRDVRKQLWEAYFEKRNGRKD